MVRPKKLNCQEAIENHDIISEDIQEIRQTLPLESTAKLREALVDVGAMLCHESKNHAASPSTGSIERIRVAIEIYKAVQNKS